MTNTEALKILSQVMDAAFKAGMFPTTKDAAIAVDAWTHIQKITPADDVSRSES